MNKSPGKAQVFPSKLKTYFFQTFPKNSKHFKVTQAFWSSHELQLWSDLEKNASWLIDVGKKLKKIAITIVILIFMAVYSQAIHQKFREPRAQSILFFFLCRESMNENESVDFVIFLVFLKPMSFSPKWNALSIFDSDGVMSYLESVELEANWKESVGR